MALVTLQEVQYDAESTFAENVVTYANTIPVLSVNPTLNQTKGTDGSIQARMNEVRPGYMDVRTAGIEFTTYTPGALADTSSGALSETWWMDLVSDALGGSTYTEVGGTVTTAGTDVDTIAFSGATLVRGGVIRVGAKSDGRADGQATVVTSGTSSPAEMLVALPAAPQNPDKIYATQMAYHSENATLGTKRFSQGFVSSQASGAQWHVHGAQMSGLKLSYPLGGGLPTTTFTYGGAYWQRSSITVPSSNTMKNCDAAPCSGGSLFVQTVGTTTRNVLNPSSLTLDIDLGLEPQVGPAATNAAYQVIRGWERTRCVPKLTVVVPWSTTYETVWDTDGSDTTHQHILFTSFPGNGSRTIGFYMPRAFLVDARPTYAANGRLLYQTLTWIGREGTDTTSALTRSSIRLFAG